MRRADRLFQLVQLLRARRFATAAQIGEALGVSVRTVYRDMRDLEASGVPVEGEAGVGYRLRPGYELPPLTFNAEEIEALVLGMRMVEAWGDPDLAAAARGVLGKVDAVLPAPLKVMLARTALFVPPIPWSDTAALGVGELRHAIGHHRKVHFRYVAADGAATERTVWPLGLYFWGRTWTLAAWCELRQGYRNFRPDRMEAVTVTPDTWDPDGGIDLAGFLAAMTEEHGPSVGRGTR